MTKEKIERKYKNKLSSKMNAIDRKFERQENTIELRKRREKELRTKRIMEMLRKELIAEKTGKLTKTTYQKSKAESTSYADACTGVQLLAKLRDTNNRGDGECITCKGTCNWETLQGGHCIAKGLSRAASLDYRNVNGQCNMCNSTAPRGGHGRYDIYKVEIDKKRGVGTLDHLLEIKTSRKQTRPIDRLKENISTIEMMLSVKTFDTTTYWTRCKKMRRKYSI